MNQLLDIYNESQSAGEFSAGYLNYLAHILATMDTQPIQKIIDCILQTVESDHVLYFIGNGGSAVTAAHFASDLALNTVSEGKKPVRAVSLADNPAILTCIGNDIGFDDIFVRQLEYLFKPNDVLFAFSVSGNSPNIIKAINYAQEQKGTVITCTGFDGGKMAQMGDISFHIPTPAGEYGPVEDIFQILDHVIYSYLRLKRVGRLIH